MLPRPMIVGATINQQRIMSMSFYNRQFLAIAEIQRKRMETAIKVAEMRYAITRQIYGF